jgi:hypothetical protein
MGYVAVVVAPCHLLLADFDVGTCDLELACCRKCSEDCFRGMPSNQVKICWAENALITLS